MNRKLQVFISSTYEDLKEERQAAVQAVLDAGHIPAGMELFAAGDKSQWESITKWIDESDAFLLILGGRYGSVEPESKKAYVELEYRYAMEKGKRFFAVVLKEEVVQKKVAQLGTKASEQSDPRWKDFYALVANKMCSFAADAKDIWIAIHKSLKEIERDEHLGWVRASEVPDLLNVTTELGSLTRENKELGRKISTLETVAQNATASAGTYPAYFAQIIDCIERTATDEAVHIACDLPGYGMFSEPSMFAKYFAAIEKAVARGVGLRMVVLDSAHRLRLIREQLGNDDQGFRRIKHKPESSFDAKLSALRETILRWRLSERHAVKEMSLDRLVKILAALQTRVGDELKRLLGSEYRTAEQFLPLYLWTSARRRAVLAIPEARAHAAAGWGRDEHAYVTFDSEMIQRMIYVSENYWAAAGMKRRR